MKLTLKETERLIKEVVASKKPWVYVYPHHPCDRQKFATTSIDGYLITTNIKYLRLN